MPSRCKINVSRTQVNNARPHGHEHVQAISLCKCIVRLVERIANRFQVLGHGAEDNSSNHHEECRGNTLARHITNDDAQMIVVDLEEVIEVSTHFLGWQQERSEFVAVVIGIFVTLFAGQHRKLNVSGEVEFALDALHVLLLFDVVLEFGKHVRERPCEFSHFVATRNFRNRHVKVSTTKLARCNGKVLERLSHAERNQKDNHKDNTVAT